MMAKLKNKLKKLDRDVALAGSTPFRPSAISDVVTLVKENRADHESGLADKLKSAITAKEALSAKLLPIEANAKKTVKDQIDALKAKLNVVSRLDEYDGKYLPLSHEVLRWRNSDGLPKLVLFSLNDPSFELRGSMHQTSMAVKKGDPDWGRATPVSNGWGATTVTTGGFGWHQYNGLINHNRMIVAQPSSPPPPETTRYLYRSTAITPLLPEPLEALYNDVYVMLRDHGERKRTIVSIKAEFNGLIPEETREKILEVKEVFKEIFIIGEPEFKWTEIAKPEPVKLPIGDPIVAGWDGQQLWYIDDFDTTAVEEAALLIGPNNS